MFIPSLLGRSIALVTMLVVFNVQYSFASTDKVALSSLFPNQEVKRCDSQPGELLLEPNQPLVLIVHGCRSSAGQFKALSKVYEHLGEQSACFEYKDRSSLDKVSGQLIDAINTLSPIVGEERIVVLGHSQGGLVTRRAHMADRVDRKTLTHSMIDIATISTPLNGINAASHCGLDWLRVASLGLVDAICYLISGSKYLEIPPQSDFISQPGQLATPVASHLIIKTNEINTCRVQSQSGTCQQDDYVFSIEEQTQAQIEKSVLSTALVVDAGHVEIVGNEITPPWKLIHVLQDNGLMKYPDGSESESFVQVVNQIYQKNNLLM
ncbi:hypothetical protein BCU68_03555 [Vibrio sp. 10N.286.49.B3]|uniref:esterase/lipase family protein n=1 Tax=Vibrio sp. 10N.286.49.B3 TaxID=1880855 RepID=UPI000C82C07B|nr:hydrolase [Vibrio sp. 10N.286.49.B3]PMH44586.1 hypothetical protein BCU68_03555 [Vibrio sp. 10N.286.49.B3]